MPVKRRVIAARGHASTSRAGTTKKGQKSTKAFAEGRKTLKQHRKTLIKAGVRAKAQDKGVKLSKKVIIRRTKRQIKATTAQRKMRLRKFGPERGDT